MLALLLPSPNSPLLYPHPQLDEAKQLVADAIRAGIFNDLVRQAPTSTFFLSSSFLPPFQGSGSNVDICVITKGKVDYIRPFSVDNVRGERFNDFSYKPGTTGTMEPLAFRLCRLTFHSLSSRAHGDCAAHCRVRAGAATVRSSRRRRPAARPGLGSSGGGADGGVTLLASQKYILSRPNHSFTPSPNLLHTMGRENAQDRRVRRQRRKEKAERAEAKKAQGDKKPSKRPEDDDAALDVGGIVEQLCLRGAVRVVVRLGCVAWRAGAALSPPEPT